MKKRIKQIAKNILYYCGVFDAFRFLQRNKIIILMYHRFSDKSEPFKIQKDVFEKQIIFFKKRYNFISLSHYADALTGIRNDLPPNPIILTIDDGYWDNYTYAYPVLKKYSIPATIFLTTNFITYGAWLWANKLEYILKNTKYKQFSFSLGGRVVNFDVGDFKNWHKTQLRIFNHCASIPNSEKNDLLASLAKELKVSVPDKAVGDFIPLNWYQVREMSAEGIEFGSHTCSHPILSQLDSDELAKEICKSKKDVENHIGREVEAISYPNGQPGDISEVVIKCVKEAGYACGVTTTVGLNSVREQDPFFLKRHCILSGDFINFAAELVSLPKITFDKKG